MNFEGGLILYPFSKIIVIVSLTWSLQTTYPWVLGQIYSARHMFPPMDWIFNPTRQWSITLIMWEPLLHHGHILPFHILLFMWVPGSWTRFSCFHSKHSTYWAISWNPVNASFQFREKVRRDTLENHWCWQPGRPASCWECLPGCVPAVLQWKWAVDAQSHIWTWIPCLLSKTLNILRMFIFIPKFSLLPFPLAICSSR